MNIASFYFLVFFSVVAVVYLYLPYKAQWIWLLAASLVFYFANCQAYTFIYVLINVGSVYVATMLFQKTKHKKLVLVITLILNVAMLAGLKYLPFAFSTYNFITGADAVVPSLVASLAISFYLLQLLAYLLEVYWERVEAERNPAKLLLYAIYFPLMTSGPINRYRTFGASLFEEHRFCYEEVVAGLKRIAYGLIKKVVLASQIQIVVDIIFDDYTNYNGLGVWIGMIAFSLNLYMDFSGCMDIVIGASRCLGISVEENFRSPFQSKTIQEFWQRWHITLGGWARDFILNPLLKSNAMVKLGRTCKKKFGKKTGKKIPIVLAMLVVWTAMGIWHGSSWKYVIGVGWWFWLIISLSTLLEPAFEKCKAALHIKDENRIWILFQQVRTFLLVCVGNLFFRAESTQKSFSMLKSTFDFHGAATQVHDIISLSLKNLGTGKLEVCAICAVAFLCVWIHDVRCYNGKSTSEIFSKQPQLVRYAVYVLICIAIIKCNGAATGDFIYQQF